MELKELKIMHQALSNANTISSTDLPPVKPSAIALGIVFNQVSAAAVLAPIFGDTYHRAKAADSKEEFFKSKEAATAAASYGSALVGSAIQTYGVAALINATGTLSYKGAGYLGALIFFASSGPGVSLLYPNIFAVIDIPLGRFCSCH